MLLCTRNKYWKYMLAIPLLFVMLFSSGIVRGDTPNQASTLDELIVMFDSSNCRECHEKTYGQWQKSHHARPLIGIDDEMLLTRYLKRVSELGKPPEQAIKRDFPCFKCHFPQIKYGTDAVAGEIAKAVLKDDKATIRKLNIGCLVCHNEKAVVHGRPEKGVVYGNKDDPDHEGPPIKKSTLLKSSLLCGQCHGLGPVLDNPDIPVQCATLYGSYLHAYIPSGGTQTCQDCHMKNHDHHIPPDFNQKEELSARLRESLPMEVQTLAYTYHPDEKAYFPMVVVKTKITSKAGHRIPDG
ncbi:MAG: multiheme c-type cytochrome (seleno)protein ExtKL [Desulfomonilaceae bacterium]